MKKNTYSRRDFIGKCLGVSSLVIGGTFVLNGCGPGKSGKNDNKAKTASGDPCDDLSGLTEEEAKQREQFGYVKQSSVAGSNCGNCRLYLPPREGKSCGGCLLFKGPVRATGYCTQYEAKS